MSNKYGIDSHKLIYHPEQVAKFKKGELLGPITMELSITGSCNHRCIFCSADYLGHNIVKIDRDLLKENVRVLSENGLKSVYMAGSGEPLLHPDAVEIVRELKNECKVDVSLSTNGILLTKDKGEQILPMLSWVRISCNAIHKNTYDYIHQGKEQDLNVVLENISDAVKLKREKNLDVTIGVQAILIKENYDEMEEMALKLRGFGVDYFTIKALAKDTRTAREVTADFSIDQIDSLEKKLNALQTDKFQTIVRIRTMEMRIKKEERLFDRCFALPFSFFLDAEGGLWACCVHVGDKAFYYGNIKDGIITNNPQAFFEKTKYLSENKDISKCILGCRFEYMNEYLYNIKLPPEHVNFI